MEQQGQQMRVGAHKGFPYNSVKLVLLAHKGFPYNSVKLVLLATGNRYEVVYNKFLLNGKALYPFKIWPVPTMTIFSTHTYL